MLKDQFVKKTWRKSAIKRAQILNNGWRVNDWRRMWCVLLLSTRILSKHVNVCICVQSLLSCHLLRHARFIQVAVISVQIIVRVVYSRVKLVVRSWWITPLNGRVFVTGVNMSLECSIVLWQIFTDMQSYNAFLVEWIITFGHHLHIRTKLSVHITG